MVTYRMMVLVVVAAFLSCKSEEKEPVCSPANPEACSAESSKELGACQAFAGARWDGEASQCLLPTGQLDCDKVSASLIWDGLRCVDAKTPKTFLRLCLDRKTTGEVLRTVQIITKHFAEPSCQRTFARLASAQKIVLNHEQIVSVEPFYGLVNLTHLDLFANQIQDISPLASLVRLRHLNLGHNQLVDISPLAALTELRDLLLLENKITDITALTKLRRLQRLDLTRNSITDFAPVESRSFRRGLFR